MICGQVWVPSGSQAGRSGTRRVNRPILLLVAFLRELGVSPQIEPEFIISPPQGRIGFYTFVRCDHEDVDRGSHRWRYPHRRLIFVLGRRRSAYAAAQAR